MTTDNNKLQQTEKFGTMPKRTWITKFTILPTPCATRKADNSNRHTEWQTALTFQNIVVSETKDCVLVPIIAHL